MSNHSNMNSSIFSEAQLRRAESMGRGLAIAGLAWVSICLLYLLTLSHGLGWHDSAELALRAEKLGATHSPGSPLHTLLGWLFIQFADSPAVATNWLSAVSMSAAAGLLALLVWQINGRLFFAAALLFACSFQVWTNAVVTELYGLSAFFSMLCAVSLWQWHQLGKSGWLVGGVIAYGLALASWFANILLLPALLWLVVANRKQVGREFVLVSAVVVAAIVSIVAANFWLTKNLPPHGPDTPDSLTGIVRYLTGAMHQPFAIRDFSFFVARVLEHAEIFSRNYFWVGIPLGLFGMYQVIKTNRVYGSYLAAIFVIQMGYFTLFGSGDYYSMVVMSYAIFSLWVASGIAWMCSRFPAWRMVFIVLLAGLPVLLVQQQLPNRLQAATFSPAQQFVDQAFAILPDNALVIAGWQQFTALEYAQQIQQQRADVQVILPATTVRYYDGNPIENYLDYVDASICSRPVITGKQTVDLMARFELLPLGPGDIWFKLAEKDAHCE
jgi:hypothetical protein